jgi:hypothetical protein
MFSTSWPLLADDDAGPGGVNLDAHAVAGALDEDARHGGLLQLLHELFADDLVLEEELGKSFLRAYQRDCQLRRTARRKPVGLVFWPMEVS